ncbi:uncharacterized protein IL334_000881 [Kwoniella shivajii]|uniref:Myb-like domain-containing protein n=1 Tax=Kwoniella shivajii TaxID=564305 RepID=A0ABZ1CQE3_9TREE|nr:hypothetical protein IL334_000881 [Kwoniella shivajii]
MKRTSSTSSPPSTPAPSANMVDIKPDLNQHTPIAKKPKSAYKGASTTGSQTPSPDSKTKNNDSTWTPEKKERFLEKIFSLGMKAANIEELCAEFGLTKLQLKNATQSGRKGNLRDKACKAIRGDTQ